MRELISVIVPIYNAERYLVSCIESIINQSYQNLEIILVNDCSEDKSADICDTYAKKDERIRVIHHEVKGGEGGAKARNSGIGQATGQVIYFVDSDDYIEENMLEKMYQIMCNEQSDCVVSSFHYVDATGQELPFRTPILSDYNAMEGKNAAKIFLTTLNIEGFSWNKLIRREIIDEHKICFDESMNSFVDMYGMFLAVFSSKKVSFYDEKPYYYRQHNTSCVHTMTKRKLDNFKKVICRICKLAEENSMREESDFFYVYRMIMLLFDAARGKKGYDKKTWRQIKQEYKWSVLFEKSLWQTYRIIFSYVKEQKVKNGIKVFWAWLHFV